MLFRFRPVCHHCHVLGLVFFLVLSWWKSVTCDYVLIQSFHCQCLSNVSRKTIILITDHHPDHGPSSWSRTTILIMDRVLITDHHPDHEPCPDTILVLVSDSLMNSRSLNQTTQGSRQKLWLSLNLLRANKEFVLLTLELTKAPLIVKSSGRVGLSCFVIFESSSHVVPGGRVNYEHLYSQSSIVWQCKRVAMTGY